MIAGQPFAPPAIPSKQQPTTASLFTRFVRYLPALALSLLCLASASCVLLLVLLPTAGLTAPFGHAHDLRSVMAPVAGYCILTGYACVWALAVASALAVVRTPPGHIPLWLYSREPGDQAYFHNVLQAVEKKLDGSLRFCRKCGAFKPDLAHHSKELGLCILTYQHWDLWANNAIGFYNHKTYLLTLGYSAFAHLLGALLLLPGVIRAEIGLSELPGRTILAVWHGGEASVTSYACLSLTASLLLGGFSLYAAATTQHAFSVFSLTRVSLLLCSTQIVAPLPRLPHRPRHDRPQLLPPARLHEPEAAKAAHPRPAIRLWAKGQLGARVRPQPVIVAAPIESRGRGQWHLLRAQRQQFGRGGYGRHDAVGKVSVGFCSLSRFFDGAHFSARPLKRSLRDNFLRFSRDAGHSERRLLCLC